MASCKQVPDKLLYLSLSSIPLLSLPIHAKNFTKENWQQDNLVSKTVFIS